MKPNSSGTAKQIFGEALEEPPDERAAFLVAACGGDTALRSEVEALLGAFDAADEFLVSKDAPVGDAERLAVAASPARRLDSPTQETRPNEGPGAVIGRYKLLQEIGHGGFGTVFMAEQREPVVRKVALKVIKLGMDTRQVIARFQAERQALAMMDHPNIAKVLDAGATSTGRPYFVMELVKGVPITQFCDDHQLAPRERLELFNDVCHAVQHAHQKGVIHRDLKPSNVLVSRYDDKPVVKIIDFGIAKAIGGKLTEQTLFTEFRALIGTPAYMSPEQAGMSDLDIDTRSDIFSLGVLLYELLTGTTPFDEKTFRRAAYDEIRRLIREVEPPKPSTKVGSAPRTSGTGAQPAGPHSGPYDLEAIARARHTDPKSLARLLRGDLDWIVMKCLEKDRGRRYDTANGLASDLQRYLTDEPVTAGPPTAAYRLRKFIRRNRVAVAIGAIVAALLVGTTVVSTASWRRADRAVEQMRRERDKAEQIARFMEDTLSGVDPETALGRNTELLEEMMDAAAKRILDGELAAAPEAELRLRLAIGWVYKCIGEFRSARKMLDPAEDLTRSLYPPDHPQSARALWLTADVSFAEGKPDEALRGFKAAQAMYQRLHPGDHSDVAALFYPISNCLDNLDRCDEALVQAQAGLEMSQRLYKGDHTEVLRGLVEVAQELAHVGRVEEALYMYDTHLPVIERQDARQNLGVARAMSNFGQCLLDVDRPADALPRFEAALGLLRRFYGRDHPAIAHGLVDVGNCLLWLDRTENAVAAYESALDMSRRMNDSPGPSIALYQAKLAEALRRASRLPEAEVNASEAVRMFRTHPEWDLTAGRAGSEWFLAHILVDTGRTAEAIDSLRQAVVHTGVHGLDPKVRVRLLDLLA